MSFSSDVKTEVAQKIMEGNDARAELSALIQMTSSLTFSSRGMTLLVSVENAAVARTIFRLVKERYNAEIELFVKRKMNLKKNRVFGMRILYNATEILTDLGLYSSRGLLDKPLLKIVQTDNNARAYLAGAFMAAGSVNPPEKKNYHLEIVASSEEHANFLISLMKRFEITGKINERRGKYVVYVKAAEKIADFLRIMEASQSVFEFEDVRISRDMTNSILRLNNIDVANEIKAQTAAMKQLEDIRILEESGKLQHLDHKLQEVAKLRVENPEASLLELAALYEQAYGKSVSKSGMKHRFVKLHDLAAEGRKEDEHPE